MGRNVRILVSVALTALFLWLAMRSVDFNAVGDALRQANYWWLVPAAAATIAGFCLRAVRWGHILRPTRRVPFQRLFPIMMIGFATNNLLPARLGEVARAYLTGSKAGVSRSTALSTIIVERVCDGITLIGLMTVTLLLFPIPMSDPRLETVVVLATVVFGLATLGLIGLLIFPDLALAPVRWLARRLPERFASRVEGLIVSFLNGLHALRSPKMLGEIAAMSLGVWLLECSAFAFVLQAFPLGLSTTEWLAAATFLLVFVNLGIMVPSVPGYVGTYQFFATLALGAFAVDPSYAFGLSVVAHTMQYTIITGIGLLSFWRLGVSVTRVGRLAPATVPVTHGPRREALD